MAREEDADGGFGWGVFLGGLLGMAAGAYLASGPGRQQVDSLRTRTIELSGSARRAASDPHSPMRRAIQDGVNAARRRRQELEAEAGAGETGPVPPPGDPQNRG